MRLDMPFRSIPRFRVFACDKTIDVAIEALKELKSQRRTACCKIGNHFSKPLSSLLVGRRAFHAHAEFFAEQENPPGSAGLDFDLVFSSPLWQRCFESLSQVQRGLCRIAPNRRFQLSQGYRAQRY